MPTDTKTQINDQLDTHGIELGKKYRDPVSNFEGYADSLHFYKYGCMRVALRGRNDTTGEPVDFMFDAPELEDAETEEPVPAGTRTGGPHGLTPPKR